MNPALRVNDVADRVVGAAHRISRCTQFLFERLDLAGIVEQKLHVVAAGEAQVSATVFVRQVRKEADGLNTQKARRSRSDGIELVPRFGHVAQHAGSK